MLTTATLEKTLSLLEKDYTFASITEKTGITLEDAEAIHIAWFKGKTEQLFRELQLARGCGNETPHGLGLGTKAQRATCFAKSCMSIPNGEESCWGNWREDSVQR